MTARSRIGAALLAAVVTGCTGAPPATVAPATVAPTVPGPPSTGIEPSAPPSEPAPDPPLEPPPPPTLVAGSTRQVGEVGSYAWPGGADSAPWLPAVALDTVELPSVARLTVEPPAALTFETWTARAAPAADAIGAAVRPLAQGRGIPAFPPPPSGAWVIAVETVFAGGVGGATWYWSVVMP